MCPSSIIGSLLWFSCQSGRPASRRVGAKCLVCSLLGRVFLAETSGLQFPRVEGSQAAFPAVGHCCRFRCPTQGRRAGGQRTAVHGGAPGRRRDLRPVQRRSRPGIRALGHRRQTSDSAGSRGNNLRNFGKAYTVGAIRDFRPSWVIWWLWVSAFRE